MKINKRILSIAGSIALAVGLLLFVLLKYPFAEVIDTFQHITQNLLIAYLAVSFCMSEETGSSCPEAVSVPALSRQIQEGYAGSGS